MAESHRPLVHRVSTRNAAVWTPELFEFRTWTPELGSLDNQPKLQEKDRDALLNIHPRRIPTPADRGSFASRPPFRPHTTAAHAHQVPLREIHSTSPWSS
ncbi:hypothetical protein VUR80DRAFT_9788 [Thermomyces stellatus]